MIWSGAAVAGGVRVPDIHLPAMEGNGREKEERSMCLESGKKREREREEGEGEEDDDIDKI